MTGFTEPLDRLTPDEKRALVCALLQRRASGEEIFPLSQGQQAMWFMYRVSPGNPAYNVPIAWRVRSQLDRTAFDGALADLVGRHPMLRTSYLELEGIPFQRIGPDSGQVRLEAVDARDLDEADFGALLTAEAMRPFDLESGPVLRWRLYDRPDGEQIILLVGHHIAMDAWSVFQCLDELASLYVARLRGKPPDLPEVQARYTDYVRWQAAMLGGAEGARLTAYWGGRLSGAPPDFGLRTDRPRPRVRGHRGDRCAVECGAELSSALHGVADAEGATLFVVLLAGFYALLHRHTGQTDLRVATPMAHRDQASFGQVVGYFADSVVLRADLSGAPSFRLLVRRVRDTVLEALDHQGLPFAALVDLLKVERDPSRPPLCDISFGMQKSHRARFRRAASASPGGAGGASLFGLRSSGADALVLDLGGLLLEPHPVSHPMSRYDLDLQLHEADGTIFGALTYDTDLFERSTVERLVGNLRVLLGAAAADPDLPISRLPMLTEEEQRLMLGWGEANG
ncbi:condensation domain-containing protein [Nonomuraea sp. NPDC049028]|uniref:condensation domain-containing protein n=1 Tax=Nonomuraea sp. NPDC049028 TaxID=3364348 RepID=UPI003722355D